MRVAFQYIDKRLWIGGHNYLLNLFCILKASKGHAVEPVLFVGEDVDSNDLEPFDKCLDEPIVRSEIFNRNRKFSRLTRTIIAGTDRSAERLFNRYGIDVVFENANFFGRRFKIPTVAWIPDFQHRHLPDMFNFWGYWKRELGFRAQISSDRKIMLSSESARVDLDSFFPGSSGKSAVVKFSVPVSEELRKTDPGSIRLQYQLPERFFYLPNQFWKHKNHEIVLKALQILKNQGKSVVVAASGQVTDYRHPKLFSQLKKHVKKNNLKENFKFLGMIPYKNLIALMRASIAVINPSFSEGWSTIVEEAKTLGVPLLLSDIPVHREQAAESAFFFDPLCPPQLVRAIESALAEFKPGPRDKEEEIAASKSVARSDLFLKQFEKIVSAAMTRQHQVNEVRI